MMKNLPVALFALGLAYALPATASAQDAAGGRTAPAAIATTAAGAVIGGAIGYYAVSGAVATVVGAVVGGAIGHWWYKKNTEQDVAALKPKSKSSFDGQHPSLQLIALGGEHPVLRAAEAAPVDE